MSKFLELQIKLLEKERVELREEIIKLKAENKEQLTSADVKQQRELLKDEDIPTFTDWLKDNGWKKTPSYYYYKKGGTTKERNLLIKMYQKEYYL